MKKHDRTFPLMNSVLIWTILHIVIPHFVLAQGPPVGAKSSQAIANIGHVYGKVTDNEGKPLSRATVFLLENRLDAASGKPKDILLKGSSTKGNGEFDFDDLPGMGKLKIKISALGFKAYEQQVSFQPAAGADHANLGQQPAAQSGMSVMGAGPSFDKTLVILGSPQTSSNWRP